MFCREVLSEVLMLAAVQEHVQSAAVVLHQVRFTVDTILVFEPLVSSHGRSLPRIACIVHACRYVSLCRMFTKAPSTRYNLIEPDLLSLGVVETTS